MNRNDYEENLNLFQANVKQVGTEIGLQYTQSIEYSIF
jgi:hypothetical protein